MIEFALPIPIKPPNCSAPGSIDVAYSVYWQVGVKLEIPSVTS